MSLPSATRNDSNWFKPLTLRLSGGILRRSRLIRCLFVFTLGLVVPQTSFALGFTYYSEVSPKPSYLRPGIEWSTGGITASPPSMGIRSIARSLTG